jgi:hypothetical protein
MKYLFGVLIVLFLISPLFCEEKKGNNIFDQANNQEKKEIDLKTDLPKDKYDKLVTPINAKIEVAEKIASLYNTETMKPDMKRDKKNERNLRMQMVANYIGAYRLSQQAVKQITEEKFNTIIVEKLEKPSLQKAIEILKSLAAESLAAKDFAAAVSLYKQVLILDPKDEDSKNALKRIDEQIRQMAKDKNKNNSIRGGDNREGYNKDNNKGYNDRYSGKNSSGKRY